MFLILLLDFAHHSLKIVHVHSAIRADVLEMHKNEGFFPNSTLKWQWLTGGGNCKSRVSIQRRQAFIFCPHFTQVALLDATRQRKAQTNNWVAMKASKTVFP
jgi:hypothetical protein